MLAFLKKHKRDVIIGVVVGLILFPLQYLIPLLGEAGITLLTATNDQISTAYVVSLAEHSPYLLDSVAHNAILQVIVFLPALLYMSTIKRLRRLRERIQDARERTLALRERLDAPKATAVETSPESVRQELDSLQVEIETESQRAKKLSNVRVAFGVTMIFWVCLVVYQWFFSLSVSRTIVQFDQCIERLRPLLTTEEEESIRAQWSSMKEQSDLDSIRDQIRSTCEKNHVAYVDF